EAAAPATPSFVVLVSNSIEDSLGSVALVKHRLLISALIALIAALALGYAGARIFARRIRRLERAAERIASGKFDEPVEDSSPDELGELARAFERMRQRLHGLEPQVDGSATGLGDEQRILQVGRALVENALRHTPTGTRVRVRTGREDGRVVLAVEDDGPGIVAEEAVHVFERFYRGDGGGSASGSGLGLAIAQELAQ